MSIIELQNICLDYQLDSDDGYNFKNAILNFYAKSRRPKVEYFRALTDISLNIDSGEKVGLIGLNGAGKSTILRVLSGIYKPNIGTVKIAKPVSPILDFATGFEQHLSGISNIRIRLMLLGLSRQEAEEKIPEIIEFSELGDFIYQPVKTYSTGMFLRLAFATSTSINPEILIADEIIGTGDAHFSMKAKYRLENFLSQDCTMVLSSHSMELVRNFCTRVIWLEHGKIVADGKTEDVINAYEGRMH